jgi:hypothetical protein
LLVRDAKHSYMALEGLDEDPMDQLRGHSITYRIALGPQQGCKVFTLQTLPDERDIECRLMAESGSPKSTNFHHLNDRFRECRNQNRGSRLLKNILVIVTAVHISAVMIDR